jgi:hypothetical protein
MPNAPGRTGSQMRFHPKIRRLSRYGWVEKTLNEMKEDGIQQFYLADVSARLKKLEGSTIKGILHFTFGIEYKRESRAYYFTGEEIRVDAG